MGRRLGRFVPALSWVPAYQRAWLTRDAIAGLAEAGPGRLAGSDHVPQAQAGRERGQVGLLGQPRQVAVAGVVG